MVESPGFDVMLLLRRPLLVVMERWTAARDTGWRAEELEEVPLVLLQPLTLVEVTSLVVEIAVNLAVDIGGRGGGVVVEVAVELTGWVM